MIFLPNMEEETHDTVTLLVKYGKTHTHEIEKTRLQLKPHVNYKCSAHGC